MECYWRYCTYTANAFTPNLKSSFAITPFILTPIGQKCKIFWICFFLFIRVIHSAEGHFLRDPNRPEMQNFLDMLLPLYPSHP